MNKNNNDIKELDKKLLNLKRKKELDEFLNTIRNLDCFVKQTIDTFDKLDKNESNIDNINIEIEQAKKYIYIFFTQLKLSDTTKKKNYRHISYERPYKSNNNSSLWVSNFSDKITKEDLYKLFSPMDNKLTLDMVSYRNKYAFINFKTPLAAETSNDRIWNIKGEVLSTNVKNSNKKIIE